jgi:hypothetical protein
MGAINTLKDRLGYNYEQKDANQTIEKGTLDNNLYYRDEENGERTYWYYAYNPSFELNTKGEYCKDSDGVFKIANKISVPADKRYAPRERYVLTQLKESVEDTIYGLIVELHKLIGTGNEEIRDPDTILGCINRVKDIIDNIDTANLHENKIVLTNENGTITTSNTTFPVNGSIKTLVGTGAWENRVQQIKVANPVSDSSTNWSTGADTIDTNYNDNNTITFNAGNKWIGLKVDKTA